MTLSWGVLSTGWIARQFAIDLLREGHTVAAVGSRFLESAQNFATSLGLDAAYGSYADLCADPGIDIIYVATPNSMHHEHAIMALRAGKHVLLEKPFAMNAAEADAILAVAHEGDRLVMEAMWTRFLPHMVRLRQIMADGILGDLRAVEVDLSQAFEVVPSAPLYRPELGGGAMYDLGVYAVSLTVDVLGLPQEVCALVRRGPGGVDTQASLLLGFDGGRQASLHVAIDSPGPMMASIIGTAARVDITPAWHRPAALSVTAADGTLLERFAPMVASRGMQYEAAAFERLVNDGARDSDVMPHAHTLGVMEVVDLVRSVDRTTRRDRNRDEHAHGVVPGMPNRSRHRACPDDPVPARARDSSVGPALPLPGDRRGHH